MLFCLQTWSNICIYTVYSTCISLGVFFFEILWHKSGGQLTHIWIVKVKISLSREKLGGVLTLEIKFYSSIYGTYTDLRFKSVWLYS
jgi:hypothetical protein